MQYPKVLLDEMRLRNFSRRTIDAYLYWNDRFLQYARKGPKEVRIGDIKDFLLHLEGQEKSASTRQVATAALQFYYGTVLCRKCALPYPKGEQRLPDILTPEEVSRMISATLNPKHRLLIMLLYSSGLRVSEAMHLKACDIHPEEQSLFVRQGKGRKDRMTVLSDAFLAEYRRFRQERTETLQDPGQEQDSCYVFSSAQGMTHLSQRSAQEITRQAAKAAGVKKRITPHSLRHSFASHLLRQGVGIAAIQALLGHSRPETTERYVRTMLPAIPRVMSPLDALGSPQDSLEVIPSRCRGARPDVQ